MLPVIFFIACIYFILNNNNEPHNLTGAALRSGFPPYVGAIAGIFAFNRSFGLDVLAPRSRSFNLVK